MCWSTPYLSVQLFRIRNLHFLDNRAACLKVCSNFCLIFRIYEALNNGVETFHSLGTFEGLMRGNKEVLITSQKGSATMVLFTVIANVTMMKQ